MRLGALLASVRKKNASVLGVVTGPPSGLGRVSAVTSAANAVVVAP